jgi:hypothetical protein
MTEATYPTDGELLALASWMHSELGRFTATGISWRHVKSEADRAALRILKRMEEAPLETRVVTR